MDTIKRIGIFYDGYSFKKTSDYYKAGHRIGRRIDFNGLQAYMLNKVADALGVGEKNCVVVGSHLYMGIVVGRDETPEQAKKNSNFRELLQRHKITPHFRPLQPNEDGTKSEKMVDSDLIADALEMAYKKEFDALVLIARDKDFVPLIEKLNAAAIASVLFWWDVPDYSIIGGPWVRGQRTAGMLIDAATYHFEMSFIADKRIKTPLEDGIFLKEPESRPPFMRQEPPAFSREEASPPPETREAYPDDSAAALPVENLVMNTAPRELTIDELGKVYESIIITLNAKENGGYVKGPAEFSDATLNNFQFGIFDIGERSVSDFRVGMKVRFKLRFDAKRSARYDNNYKLYRVYNMVIA